MSYAETQVSPNAITAFDKMKFEHGYKWIIFQINDQNTIVPDKYGDRCNAETREEDKKKFEEMKAFLSAAEPAYVVYHFGFTTSKGISIHKAVFLTW